MQIEILYNNLFLKNKKLTLILYNLTYWNLIMFGMRSLKKKITGLSEN